MNKAFSPEEFKKWLGEQPKKMVVVKALLKSPQGNILIAKPTFKDTWQLPGGGVEADENPEDALVREVYEELGVHIDKQALKVVKAIHKEGDDSLFLIYEYHNPIAEDDTFTLPADELKTYEFVLPAILKDRLPEYYADFIAEYTA